MDLTPRDATDLARFMARRFPERAQVDQLARKAGVELDDTLAGDLVAVWSTVVVEARIQGRLRPLARTLARSHRDDERLQEVCALLLALEDPQPLPRAAWIGGGLLAVALLAAGVGWALGGRGGAGAGVDLPAAELPAAAPAAAVAAAPPAAVEVAPPAAVEAAPPAAVEEASAPAASPPGAAATEQPPVAAAAPALAAVVPVAASSGCAAAPGELVGYWYAGPAAPGAQGQTITLPQAVNVRADYPDVHNGYDARTTVRCTLRRGDRQRLSRAPIAVPGGAWWVPVTGGDLAQ